MEHLSDYQDVKRAPKDPKFGAPRDTNKKRQRHSKGHPRRCREHHEGAQCTPKATKGTPRASKRERTKKNTNKLCVSQESSPILVSHLLDHAWRTVLQKLQNRALTICMTQQQGSEAACFQGRSLSAINVIATPTELAASSRSATVGDCSISSGPSPCRQRTICETSQQPGPQGRSHQCPTTGSAVIQLHRVRR